MENIQFDPSQYTILVVEDNATNLYLLIELLVDDGYNVRPVTNGLQSVQMAEDILPDLVLLDVMIPGLNGYEVCRMLKGNPKTQEIPVIFITAVAQVSDKIRGFELGAVDYITKPFNIKEVIVRIKAQLLRRSRYQVLEQKIKSLEQTLSNSSPSDFSSSEQGKVWGVRISNLPGMVYRYTNRQQREFELVSQGSLELTGYSPEVLINGEISYSRDVIHPDDRDSIKAARQEAIAEQKEIELIYRIYTQNKTIKWVWDKGHIMISTTGNFIALEGLIQDITQFKNIEKELQQSEERWQLALWANNDGIWDWDVTCNQVFYSLNWKTMLGYTENEITNHPDEWRTRIHPDDLNPTMTKVEEHLNRVSPEYVGEHRLQCKDGSYKWILGRGKALWDEEGRLVRMVGSNTDITSSKKTEQLLQEAKETAEAASQEKSEFLARMGHELRTPLHSILGFTQVLIKEVSLNPNWLPKYLEYLQIVQRSGQHLLELINSILDMSSLQAGETQLNNRCIDFDRFMAGLQHRYDPLAQNQGLEFCIKRSPDLPKFIKIDDEKLRQVLVHLLGNAFKFTRSGTISLTIEYLQTGLPKPILHWIIADTGSGIAPEELQRLFEPFAQTRTGRNRQTGTGLGVCISQKLLDLMGGSLNVSSQLGQGTEIQVDIPIEIPSPTEQENAYISQITEWISVQEIEPTELYSHEDLEQLVTRLPKTWRKQLKQAALEADREKLYHLIEQLPSSHQALTQTLTGWVDRFEFDSLIHLFNSVSV